MALLTKDQIKKADTLKYQDEPVPEWGGSVRVSQMTAGERDFYEDSIYDAGVDATVKVKREDFRAKMLLFCLKNEDGKPLFDSIKEITNLSAKPIQRLYDVAQELNGMSKAAQEVIKKK